MSTLKLPFTLERTSSTSPVTTAGDVDISAIDGLESSTVQAALEELNSKTPELPDNLPNDEDVVHNTGDEDIEGDKTFVDNVKINGSLTVNDGLNADTAAIGGALDVGGNIKADGYIYSADEMVATRSWVNGQLAEQSQVVDLKNKKTSGSTIAKNSVYVYDGTPVHSRGVTLSAGGLATVIGNNYIGNSLLIFCITHIDLVQKSYIVYMNNPSDTNTWLWIKNLTYNSTNEVPVALRDLFAEYKEASSSEHGLMSAADKAQLGTNTSDIAENKTNIAANSALIASLQQSGLPTGGEYSFSFVEEAVMEGLTAENTTAAVLYFGLEEDVTEVSHATYDKGYCSTNVTYSNGYAAVGGSYDKGFVSI